MSVSSTLIIAQGIAVISPLAICVAFFSIVGTLAIGISVLPQTIDTIKNKQTQTFSMLMYIFLVVGCFFLAIYGIGLVEAGNSIENGYYSSDNIGFLSAAFSHWYENGANQAAFTKYVNALNKANYDGNANALAAALVIAGKHTVDNANLPTANFSPLNAQGYVTQTEPDAIVITPGSYRNYEVNYTTPGGLLIIGEGFASITSAIVLVYKIKNMVNAKKAGLTEAEYCTKMLEQKKAMKGSMVK